VPTTGFGFRHFLYASAALVAIHVVGVIGFVTILGEGPFEAFYRTVMLVSTVGLEPLPTTTGAKVLAIAIVVSGVALLLYVVGLTIHFTVSGIVSGAWQDRQVRRTVSKLDGHYLICGYGRVGRRVAEEFGAEGAGCVIIDPDPSAAALARDRGLTVVEASATEDDALERAGIGRASGLVACVESDAENLFIVLSARELRPDLLIVSRASSPDAATKLRRGGADRVVTPYEIAGRELATLLLRPQVSAFLDVVVGPGGPDIRFEQVEVTAKALEAGRSIRVLRVREQTGAMIVAHKTREGGFNTRPDPDATLEVGDVLIAVGTEEELKELERLFRAESVTA
jgi:voltage-gated potassium channel